MKRVVIMMLWSVAAWAKWGTARVATPASCATGTTCAITVSSIGSGHLLVLYTTTVKQNITIIGVTGGGMGSFESATPTAWYRPSGGGGQPLKGCSASDSTAGSIDCAFLYSSTAGSTTVTVTYSGVTGGAKVFFYEVPYSNGPIAMDVYPGARDQTPSGSTTNGIGLNLTGRNDFIVQGINGENTIASINSGYTILKNGSSAAAYLSNTTSGTAPIWVSSSGAHGAVSGIAFTEATGVVPGLSTAWQAANRTGVDGNSCYEQGNVFVSGGYLLMLTTRQNTDCESIDYAYGLKAYRSSSISLRTIRFTYGTVEFRARLGGGNSTGAWPVFEMFNACSQISYAYGTDNNCGSTEEIDITEINGSNFLKINQQIHLSNGNHNDGCSASVTDASRIFHTYDLIWSPGSLIWKIDGRTTCTITRSYVPSDAMYFFIDMNAGANGGTIDDNSLPWVTLVDFVKITHGSTVILNAEFH